MAIEMTPAVENGMIKAVIGLLAAIIGGIIGAISAQSIVQRRIQMENVTQERAKWRDRIRCLASEVHETIMMKDDLDLRKEKLYRLQNQFRALLNPSDHKDKKIIGIIDCVIGEACCKPESKDCCKSKLPEAQAKDFGKHISYLLKHDWERAKEEVKHPLFQWRKPRRHEPDSTSSPPFLKRAWQKILEYDWQKILEYYKLPRIILLLVVIPIMIVYYIRFINCVYRVGFPKS